MKDYGNFALVEITSNARCRLLASLNPNAEDPIQGKTYSSAWSLSIEEAAKQFLQFGFWGTWSRINSLQYGGITLTDGMSESEADLFIRYNAAKEEIGNSVHLAEQIKRLPSGKYLFILQEEKEKEYIAEVDLCKEDFQRYNALLDISDLSENSKYTTEQIDRLNARQHDSIQVCTAAFGDDITVEIALLSGDTNYWVETTIYKHGWPSTAEPEFSINEEEKICCEDVTCLIKFNLI